MKISIIIPVYNSAPYLPLCINSLLVQDYLDFEILLIDDGSSDSSLIICKEYALKDCRIKVFSQENKGASAARNKGLLEAKGDWVCFIDSDDWVEPGYLKDFIRENCLENELVIQGMFFDRENGDKDVKKLLDNNYLKEEMAKCFVENELFLYGTPCCKLFSNKIIKKNSLAFPENISFGEDSLFFMSYLEYVDKICTISCVNYHYRIENQNSLSHTKHRPEKLLIFYTNYYSLVGKIIISSFDFPNEKYFIFYKNQFDGIMTIVFNMFHYKYTYEMRKKNYTSIKSFYKSEYEKFAILPVLQRGILNMVLINNYILVDAFLKSLYIFRNILKKKYSK